MHKWGYGVHVHDCTCLWDTKSIHTMHIYIHGIFYLSLYDMDIVKTLLSLLLSVCQNKPSLFIEITSI